MAGVKVKPFIKINVTSDTVCPWCYIGKKHLEKAMNVCKDKYNFEVRWHPFFLNPNAPKEGINKLDYYKKKFGESCATTILERVAKAFAEVGITFKQGGLTGSTLDSHRLILLAGKQGWQTQNALVEELFSNYFTQEKYIGDKNVLLEAAMKTNVEGAQEWLENPNNGMEEIQEELSSYANGVTGVPHFTINNQNHLSGAQPVEAFLRSFDLATRNG